ncbi:hypothetical protein [Flagellimonas sp.]|uniref:hypothetical protein n=1 Tax=Flagellimonas sp. TaxID=2058762 RepID=UPI003BAA4337
MDKKEFLGLVDASRLNKVELSNVLNLSRTTVYKWFSGEEIPKKYHSLIRNVLSKSPKELKELARLENPSFENSAKRILLNEGLFRRTGELGELVTFMIKNYEELQHHPLFKMFTERIEKEAEIKYKEWLVKQIDEETLTKEELIKKLLQKRST